MFRSIGRVVLPLSPLTPCGGAGFVVGDSLLMTNRHIAQLCSQGLVIKILYNRRVAAPSISTMRLPITRPTSSPDAPSR